MVSRSLFVKKIICGLNLISIFSPYQNPPSPNEHLSKGLDTLIHGLSPCITQNSRLYLTETTRLFTQLWASLQSGEADGGVVRQSLTRLKLAP